MKTILIILCFVMLCSLSLFASMSDSKIKESDGKITVKQNGVSEYEHTKKKLEYNQDEKLKLTLIQSGIDNGLISKIIKINCYEQIDFLKKLGIELPSRLNNTNVDNFKPTEIQIKIKREQISLLLGKKIDIVPQIEPSKSSKELSNGERGRDTYTTEGNDGWLYEGDYIINGSEFYSSDVVLGNSFLTWGRAYYNLEVPNAIPLEQLYVGCRGRSNDNQYSQGGGDFFIWNWNISEWEYLFHLPGEEPDGWWAYDIIDDFSTYVSSSGYISIYVYYDFDTAVDDDDYHVDWVIVSYSVNYTAPDIYSVETVNTIPSSEPYQYWDFEIDIDATSSNGVAAGVAITISDNHSNNWGPFFEENFIGYETWDNVVYGTWDYNWYQFDEPTDVLFTIHAENCQGDDDYQIWVEVDEVPSNADNELILPINTLYQNHPNPFITSTYIEFIIRKESKATLSIFNVKGQLVENAEFGEGYHTFEWNAEKHSSGIYYYTLETKNYNETRKMILLK